MEMFDADRIPTAETDTEYAAYCSTNSYCQWPSLYYSFIYDTDENQTLATRLKKRTHM